MSDVRKNLPGVEDTMMRKRPSHEQVPRHNHQNAGPVEGTEAGEVADSV
jgi:hypothetical protein